MYKKTQLHIILSLVIIHLLPVTTQGYTRDSTFQHLVYMLFHANTFHLVGNCYAAWYILNNKVFTWAKMIVVIYVISVISSFITYNSMPTVGFSAPLFAATGINYHVSTSKKHFIPLLVTTLICWITLPSINTSLHVICFILGYLYTFIHYQTKEVLHDRERVGC